MKTTFLLLTLTQAIHSFEEWFFQLWVVYEPAALVANLFGSDPSFSFALLNILLVGLMCASFAILRRPVASRWLMYVWIAIELINGGNHLLQAYLAGDYFPGAYSAPLLLFFSVRLTIMMNRHSSAEQAL